MKLAIYIYSGLLISRIYDSSSPFCESCLIPNKKFQFEFVVHKLRAGLFSYDNLTYLYFPGKSVFQNST